MPKEINDTYPLLLLLLLIPIPHVLIIILMILIYLRYRPTRHLIALIISIVIFVVISWLIPAYIRLSLIDYGNVIKGVFSLFKQSNTSGIFRYILIAPVNFHLSSIIFYLHIAVMVALGLEVYWASRKDILAVPKSKTKGKLKAMQSGEYTVIGYKGKAREIVIENDARHVFVCGTTGSGKTVAISNFIESAVKYDYPMLIVDGKGDTNDGSLLDIVNKYRRNKKVYIINMTDPKTSDKYNPFQNASPSIIKDMLINLSDWSEEHYKVNTERYMQRLVTLMELLKIEINFTNLLYYMSKKGMEDLALEAKNQNLISKIEYAGTLEMIETSSLIVSGASARFANIFESDMKGVFGEGGVDIYTAIKEKAIILFILNPLIYPELTPSLGRLILIDSKKAVSKLFQEQEHRTFFMFDEINTYASPVFMDLLNKSRSANITCIAATQSLSDLDQAAGEAFREQVIENCNNYIVLRQNSAKNAEAWAEILGTEETSHFTWQFDEKDGRRKPTGAGTIKKERQFIYHPEDIKNLKQGQAIYMCKDNGKHQQFKVRKGF